MDRCCKTCRWAEWQRTPKGRIARTDPGRCEYPLPDFDRLPASVTTYAPPNKGGIWPDMGTRCLCWEPKGE